MRLLNTTTVKLTEFFGENIPPYAILSHTWETEEVSFQEICSLSATVRQKKGFEKIQKTCEIAKQENLDWAWVDTCCINKESSSELSEAINSMWQWYRRAKVCYAYLSDLHGDTIKNGLASCKWFSDGSREGELSCPLRGIVNWAPFVLNQNKFTRGWTLQELIAPDKLIFFDSNWRSRGDKEEHVQLLSSITGIKSYILMPNLEKLLYECFWLVDKYFFAETIELDVLLSEVPVAHRMTWASKRKTTRVEDTAYSLLGIFNVHMPLLYGEGSNSFRRLQEEILKTSTDMSILAWKAPENTAQYFGPLAPSVTCFGHVNFDFVFKSTMTVSSWGLKFSSKSLRPLVSDIRGDHPVLYRIPLIASAGSKNELCLMVGRQSNSNWYIRENDRHGGLVTADHAGPPIYDVAVTNDDPDIYLVPDTMLWVNDWDRKIPWIKVAMSDDTRLIRIVPRSCWDHVYSSIYGHEQAAIVAACGRESPVLFVVFCMSWDHFENVYAVSYSSPAGQYILQTLDHGLRVKPTDLYFWNLEPLRWQENGSSKIGGFIARFPNTEGDLSVRISMSSEKISESRKQNCISISCISDSSQK